MSRWKKLSPFNERDQVLTKKENPSVTYYGTPKVIFESHVWRKINGWCKAAKSEVSGLGLVRKLDPNTFLVYDAMIAKQYCSAGWTELAREGLDSLMLGLRRRNIPLTECKFWWHTHYNFGVGWSGTDEDNARRLVKQAKDWHVSTVINQMGDHLTRVDYNSPELLIDAVETKVEGGRKPNKRRFAKDIATFVRPLEDKPVKPLPKGQIIPSKELKDDEDFLGGFINYGGVIMPLREWVRLNALENGVTAPEPSKLKIHKETQKPYTFDDYIRDLKENRDEPSRDSDGSLAGKDDDKAHLWYD